MSWRSLTLTPGAWNVFSSKHTKTKADNVLNTPDSSYGGYGGQWPLKQISEMCPNHACLLRGSASKRKLIVPHKAPSASQTPCQSCPQADFWLAM